MTKSEVLNTLKTCFSLEQEKDFFKAMNKNFEDLTEKEVKKIFEAIQQEEQKLLSVKFLKDETKTKEEETEVQQEEKFLKLMKKLSQQLENKQRKV